MTFPEVYILRHGETEWNAANRMQGARHSPLTAKGQAQAAAQGRILAGCDLAGFAFYCSPQMRAVQTAGIALAQLATDIRTDPRLREIDVGDWSGMQRDALPVFDGPDAALRQYDAAPNGEGLAALEQRCAAFLADLTGPAVIVTHGVTGHRLRFLLAGQGAADSVDVHGGQGIVYHLKNGVQKLLG